MKQVLLVIFSFFLLQLYAFDPDIKHLIKEAGNEKDYPGKSEVIIFDSTRVDVHESGLSLVNIHRLVKVLNWEGAKNNAVIIFGYDPLSAFVEIKSVKIFHISGNVE